MIADVRLGPRVTLLAVSAGGHRIPQPQASRHALSKGLDRSMVLFSIRPAQAQLLFTFTPNAPSRGLSRPINIMLGIMRSRLVVTSVNDTSHHKPSAHNLHYIKWPQPPLRGSVACASAQALYGIRRPPAGARCALRSPPNNPRWCSVVLFLVKLCSLARTRTHRKGRGLFGLVGGCPEKKSIGGAERVKAVSDRVCQRAQPVKAKSHTCDAGATLTSLRALAVVNH